MKKIYFVAIIVIIFFAVFYWYESIPPTEEQRALVEGLLSNGMKFEDVQYHFFWAVVAWTIYTVGTAVVFYLVAGKDEETRL